MLLGSTTERVLRQTTVPVLVAPPPEQTPPNTDPSRIDVGRVLAPVDFKDGCLTDVRAAATLAQTFDVPLLLVHVVAPLKGLERLQATAGHAQPGPDRASRATDPAARLRGGHASTHRNCRRASDHLPRTSPRSLSRAASGSSSRAFDVRSTCSDRGQDLSRIACWVWRQPGCWHFHQDMRT